MFSCALLVLFLHFPPMGSPIPLLVRVALVQMSGVTPCKKPKDRIFMLVEIYPSFEG